jgi:phosphomannomutase
MGDIAAGLTELGQDAFGKGLPGHLLDPTLLREYDIRGIVGETLNEADARAIGRAFGEIVAAHGQRIAVGRDGRLSSPMLERALVEGMLDAGHAVESIGIGPTPMLYFAVHHLGTAAGIMVTGSHNPPDHNGFKMVIGSQPVYGAAIEELGRIAARTAPPASAGRFCEVSVFRAYIDRLCRDYDGDRSLRVAWDAGNGATGEAVTALVARLPGQHVLLNATIDGRFPAHHPDPTVPENLAQLQSTVIAEGCDFGVAFDGDGDRIGIVDGEGRILSGDQLLMLFARDVLENQPGSPIIADVKASQALYDDVAARGGIPIMWKSGHALLRTKLAETGGPFAGELSGHVFFADRFYGHDDALYAAVRFLAITSRAGRSVADMRDALPSAVNTPEIRFPCADATKFAAIERVKAHLRAAKASVNEIDGVRVTTPDGWWLLRASNTQAMLVARCEARDPAALERVKSAMLETLGAAGIEAPPV